MASEWGYEEVTSLLLEHGADGTAQTNDGSTPLHFASQGDLKTLLACFSSMTRIKQRRPTAINSIAFRVAKGVRRSCPSTSRSWCGCDSPGYLPGYSSSPVFAGRT